jgi:hypothetical protein
MLSHFEHINYEYPDTMLFLSGDLNSQCMFLDDRRNVEKFR